MEMNQTQALQRAAELINPQRAEDIRRLLNWKNGGCLSRDSLPPDADKISGEEDAAIRALWHTLPGTACLMDAIHLLINNQEPIDEPARRFTLEQDDWTCHEPDALWLECRDLRKAEVSNNITRLDRLSKREPALVV